MHIQSAKKKRVQNINLDESFHICAFFVVVFSPILLLLSEQERVS